MTDTVRRLQIALDYFRWVPHLTQRRWLLDDSKIKVASCGRRWGKTEAQAIDAATFAIANKRSRQMIVSPTYDQSRLIFDAVERLMLDSEMSRDLVKVTRSPYPRINYRGSLIMARTADEDGRNLRGHSADRVTVDEAAYVKDRVIEEVISPMLADRNGQLILISTPFGKNHFYRTFTLGQKGEPGYASFQFASWENPHISREYIDRQREKLSERQFRVEYQAEFMDDQSAVFPWAHIEAAMNTLATPPAADCGRIAGVDWARYSDYTAVVVLDPGATPHSVVAIDRFNGMSWQSQVRRVVDLLIKHRVSQVLVDQTSIGDPLLEQLRTALWRDRGVNMDVQGLVFTNTSKREIIDNLQVRFAHGDLAIPCDEELVRELQYFEFELTNSGSVRLNARYGYHDDLVTALALAAWAARDRHHIQEARFLTTGHSAWSGDGF